MTESRASGEGRVYATTLVCRAATAETRAHVPYNIVLVDAIEGFRMMAHGEKDLAIAMRSWLVSRRSLGGSCPISSEDDSLMSQARLCRDRRRSRAAMAAKVGKSRDG